MRTLNDDTNEPSPWGRLFQTFRGGGSDYTPTDFSRMSDDEKRKYISAIAPTERRIGWIAAALGAAITLVLIVPYMVTKKYAVTDGIKPKNKTCPPVAPHIRYITQGGKGVCEALFPPSHFVLDLVLPLAFAALVVVSLYLHRRTWLAFGILLLGLSLSTYDILITVPFIVAGGWIMLRAYRTQKYGVPNQKFIQPGWSPPATRANSRRPRSSGPSGTGPSRSGKSGTTTQNRKAPSQNKRYTPRTPPKPAKKTATR
jgi:hypothetical protein